MMPTWGEAGQNFDFFVQKNWFFCNTVVNISVKILWRHAIFTLVYQTRLK